MSELIGKDILKELSVEDMLDMEMDQVEDLAGFLLPPKGYYRFLITESKLDTAGEKQVIKLTFQIQETIELVNPDDKPAEEGGTFDQTYFPGFGVQQFKTEFVEVARAAGFVTFRDAIEGLAGMEISAHVGHRKDKNDKEKVYPTVSKVSAI